MSFLSLSRSILLGCSALMGASVFAMEMEATKLTDTPHILSVKLKTVRSNAGHAGGMPTRTQEVVARVRYTNRCHVPEGFYVTQQSSDARQQYSYSLMEKREPNKICPKNIRYEYVDVTIDTIGSIDIPPKVTVNGVR